MKGVEIFHIHYTREREEKVDCISSRRLGEKIGRVDKVIHSFTHSFTHSQDSQDSQDLTPRQKRSERETPKIESKKQDSPPSILQFYPCNLATSEGEENDEGWMTGCLVDEGMKGEESRAGVHSCEHKKRRLK